MKPNFPKYESYELNNLADILKSLLIRLDIDNLKTRRVTGTTDSVANTSRLFRHGFSKRPWMVLPYTGDIYIQTIGNDDVDIRSARTSQDFEVIVFG